MHRHHRRRWRQDAELQSRGRCSGLPTWGSGLLTGGSIRKGRCSIRHIASSKTGPHSFTLGDLFDASRTSPRSTKGPLGTLITSQQVQVKPLRAPMLQLWGRGWARRRLQSGLLLGWAGSEWPGRCLGVPLDIARMKPQYCRLTSDPLPFYHPG